MPDPYWNSGGTNREPAGYSDAWNRQIPQTAQGNLEYIQTARMYLYDSNHSPHPTPTPTPSPSPNPSPDPDPNLTLTLTLTLARYLYDSTLYKPTTEGWLGFELSRTPPPLEEHLPTLELALASLLGQGNAPQP